RGRAMSRSRHPRRCSGRRAVPRRGGLRRARSAGPRRRCRSHARHVRRAHARAVRSRSRDRGCVAHPRHRLPRARLPRRARRRRRRPSRRTTRRTRQTAPSPPRIRPRVVNSAHAAQCRVGAFSRCGFAPFSVRSTDTRTKETTMSKATEAVDNLIIGGGQAGLTVAYYLKKHKRPFVILDANARIGDVWRNRWDSLRLFTPARFTGLPGMRFPRSGGSYPTKDEMADYLEAYAARFGLAVRTGVTVDRVSR